MHSNDNLIQQTNRWLILALSVLLITIALTIPLQAMASCVCPNPQGEDGQAIFFCQKCNDFVNDPKTKTPFPLKPFIEKLQTCSHIGSTRELCSEAFNKNKIAISETNRAQLGFSSYLPKTKILQWQKFCEKDTNKEFQPIELKPSYTPLELIQITKAGLLLLDETFATNQNKIRYALSLARAFFYHKYKKWPETESDFFKLHNITFAFYSLYRCSEKNNEVEISEQDKSEQHKKTSIQAFCKKTGIRKDTQTCFQAYRKKELDLIKELERLAKTQEKEITTELVKEIQEMFTEEDHLIFPPNKLKQATNITVSILKERIKNNGIATWYYQRFTGNDSQTENSLIISIKLDDDACHCKHFLVDHGVEFSTDDTSLALSAIDKITDMQTALPSGQAIIDLQKLLALHFTIKKEASINQDIKQMTRALFLCTLEVPYICARQHMNYSIGTAEKTALLAPSLFLAYSLLRLFDHLE